ncbi:MAG TPA: NAD(P)-dependent oxidoreductase [Methylomirabilota bacterium]|jgi:D-3-phosphoglycerate dehydrogenase / 2-oxoglutarate reductase|nr:NAD(P)-dependent oxidoreductase [Methylomirabilota bacterium]
MIVIPDDFPSVFEGSPAHERAKKLADVTVFSERGADAEQELIRRIGRAEVAINIRAHARFSEAVFAACPALKMVCVWGTGTDNIDLNAAGMRGVTICNTPGVNAFAVAEHALALMLAVARKVPTLDAEMRKGKWPRELHTQLVGKTLGVFGMGTIGARVAALGKGIGMNVLGWSALGQEARIRAAGATPATKEEILAKADVISLHVRLSTDTRGFIGRKELGMMKPTAILVNTGRGALVDLDALMGALKERKILGAGLDVFHQEPLAPDDPILSLPNVVLSPHNGGQTPEVIRDGLLRAVENVEHYLQGKPRDVVVAPVR